MATAESIVLPVTFERVIGETRDPRAAAATGFSMLVITFLLQYSEWLFAVQLPSEMMFEIIIIANFVNVALGSGARDAKFWIKKKEIDDWGKARWLMAGPVWFAAALFG